MTIRGLLFDIDDTLIDYSGTARTGILRHLTAEGLLDRFASPDEAVALWREIEEREYPRFLAGELTFTGQQQVRTAMFLDHIGASTEDAEAWFARYASRRDTAWTTFPDVLPAFQRFAGRVGLGVVSNASLDYQTGKLYTVGLLHHFGENILCSSEFGAAKPDPSIFLAGCDLLGLSPHEVGFVGDRYDVDALGARDAGLQAYWLDRESLGRAPEAGVTIIHSLDELAATLN
ncbi:HAD family hydrolase [Nocardia sp. NBC_00511]|uniref:HAD family hydrolase n=1 Tax=Nocardia sp. NBC_00511 TaxID=2903591 RepID=UPI0030E45AEC